MATTKNYGPSGAPGAPAPGINTVANAKSPAPLPAQVVGNVTTEQVVQNPAITSVANPVALVVQVPANSALEQKPFEVSVSGYITAGAAENVTLNLYAGTSTTPGNDTLLKSSGAGAIAGASSFPFWIKARLIYDSVSGKLTGTVQFVMGALLVAEGLVTNEPTGISNVNNPVISFCVSVTFSVANANNLLNVADFSINF